MEGEYGRMFLRNFHSAELLPGQTSVSHSLLRAPEPAVEDVHKCNAAEDATKQMQISRSAPELTPEIQEECEASLWEQKSVCRNSWHFPRTELPELDASFDLDLTGTIRSEEADSLAASSDSEHCSLSSVAHQSATSEVETTQSPRALGTACNATMIPAHSVGELVKHKCMAFGRNRSSDNMSVKLACHQGDAGSITTSPDFLVEAVTAVRELMARSEEIADEGPRATSSSLRSSDARFPLKSQRLAVEASQDAANGSFVFGKKEEDKSAPGVARRGNSFNILNFGKNELNARSSVPPIMSRPQRQPCTSCLSSPSKAQDTKAPAQPAQALEFDDDFDDTDEVPVHKVAGVVDRNLFTDTQEIPMSLPRMNMTQSMTHSRKSVDKQELSVGLWKSMVTVSQLKPSITISIPDSICVFKH